MPRFVCAMVDTETVAEKHKNRYLELVAFRDSSSHGRALSTIPPGERYASVPMPR